MVLSYPPKCGLLQPEWKDLNHGLEVVIPAQIRASTTDTLLSTEKTDEGCHTHSNAGFYNDTGVRINNIVFSCHTRSNAGFYNTFI